jgi:hypothetical protein
MQSGRSLYFISAATIIEVLEVLPNEIRLRKGQKKERKK